MSSDKELRPLFVHIRIFYVIVSQELLVHLV